MRITIKKTIALLLALLLTVGITACVKTAAETPSEPKPAAAEETQKEPAETAAPTPLTKEFTDSLGRTVELPAIIEKYAASGTMAQTVLFALCPDKLAGLSGAWDDCAKPYLDSKYCDLPVLGQLYGGKGELNLETLLASGAQIVIDVGEPKGSIAEDLDALQEQTGIPFVHITMHTDTMGDAYRLLGELLNLPEEAETLAAYCESVYGRTLTIASSVEKAKLLYILGDEGLNVIAKGSYHAEIIDLLSDNLAVVDEPSSKGTGNEVDAEQLLVWNPDVILIATDSVYGTIGDDPLLQNISAIQTGRYYEVPQGPHNWMGFPPSVQRLLGMLWMGKLLYPDAADYDLREEVTQYYKLFYHCDLTEELYNSLVKNSIGK